MARVERWELGWPMVDFLEVIGLVVLQEVKPMLLGLDLGTT